MGRGKACTAPRAPRVRSQGIQLVSARLPDAVCTRLRLLQLRRVPRELSEEHLVRVRVRVSVRVRVRDRINLT